MLLAEREDNSVVHLRPCTIDPKLGGQPWQIVCLPIRMHWNLARGREKSIGSTTHTHTLAPTHAFMHAGTSANVHAQIRPRLGKIRTWRALLARPIGISLIWLNVLLCCRPLFCVVRSFVLVVAYRDIHGGAEGAS